jgi:adenylate cyclase
LRAAGQISSDASAADAARRQAIRAHLDTVIASPILASSPRRVQLLLYLCNRALEGTGEQINEYAIGVDVFEKTSSFDPRIDSIVRTEMGRLRHKLNDYYASESEASTVRIELPLRSYVPAFKFAGGEARTAAPSFGGPVKPSARPRIWTAALLIVLGLAVAVSLAWLWRNNHAVQPSIAVLPFLNLTGDPDKEFLGDSITDELTGTFAEAGDMRVVARTSSFVFKGKNVDVREIGRALKANTLLEGSISRKMDRLSIVAQLIRSEDGYHLWSQTFTFVPDDLQKTEAEIVRSVANVLQGKQTEFVDASQLMSTKSPEAHDLYLRARYTFSRGTLEGTQTSLKLARQAMEKDPAYPLPYWLAANAEYTLSSFGVQSPAAGWEHQMQELDQAIRLEPRFGDAHASHALGVYSVFHDWPRAEEEFQLAVRLGSVTAPSLYGWGLTTRGRFAEAHRQLSAAIERDPLAPGPRLHSLIVYYFEGNEAKARSEVDRVLELNPQNITALVQLAFGDALAKHCDAAKVDLAKLKKIGPGLAATQFVEAITGITCGQPAEARRILAAMEAPDYSGRSFFQMALLDQALGDSDRMFDHLEKAAQNFENAVLYLKVHPLFKPFWHDPRFISLAGRLGLQ